MEYLYIVIGWIVVVAFAITFIVTIFSLIGKISIEQKYFKFLFFKLLLEIVAAGFFLFYSGVQPLASTPDLVGEWEYKCTQHGKGYEHGGVCIIQKEKSSYGCRFRISGERTWHRNWSSNNQSNKRIQIDPGFSWSTDWCAITGKDEIRLSYTITTNDGTIKGYGKGLIKYENGGSKAIVGTFYQLPPYNAIHGGMEFVRKK